MDSPRTVHAVCSLDCPDTCSVLVSVDDAGRATRVRGNPDHPVTRGFLCAKVTKYLDLVYAPDRLLQPMRRRAGVPKGPIAPGQQSAVFEPISWDEALDTIAAKFKAIAAEFGPESNLPYSYAGNMGVLGFGSMDRRFFFRLGASQLDRTICAAAGGEALMLVYGVRLGTDIEDFRHARTILAWGANIHGNNVHLWPFVEEARRNGARLIVIDPYRTRTARAADWHLPIRPGTDAALALGLMHVLIREGLTDAAYIAECTHGFDALRERAAAYPPEKVAAITGLAADDIVRLAREYAMNTPSAIRMNYGVQRSENGGTAARAIAMLPCLTGAWKQRGGGLQLSTSGVFSLNKAALERPDLAAASSIGRPGRVVNMSRLGHALTELGQHAADGPPVKALYVYNSNPAVIAPNQTAVLHGLRREDLFTVVHEQSWTDTTDYADIVLPATTFLEHEDFQGAYGHYYLQHSTQAIAPRGEARSNVAVFRGLAARMGFIEPCFQDSEATMIDQALIGAPSPGLAGMTRQRLTAEHSIRVQPVSADGSALPFSTPAWFRTPSGRAEFFSETLAARGLDPLPDYVPPVESRHGAAAAEYPLELLARKADNHMNSTFAGLPGHRALEKEHAGVLEMHPEDAAARGIQNGDVVEVWNARGSLTLIARLPQGEPAAVPPGVAACRLVWNKLARGWRGINTLTSERLTDLGGGPTFYSTMVEVRRAAAAGIQQEEQE